MNKGEDIDLRFLSEISFSWIFTRIMNQIELFLNKVKNIYLIILNDLTVSNYKYK